MSFAVEDSKLKNKHLIPKFNNAPKDRYNVWRRRVEFALKTKGLWKLVIGEGTRPAYHLNIQNPIAEEGQDELQPNPISQEEFNYSEEVRTWIQKEENASSLLMSVLGDDIVNDPMNELGDPVAMWNVLESTYSSKTGTNILTILNGVVTKKLGRSERMSTHIGHLDSLFLELTNIQGKNEGIDGKSKDLTVTGDFFQICMLLASISDVGEYDAVIEAIRGVSDEDGATNHRAVKNRLLESFSEKHPEKGSIFGNKCIQPGHHKHGKSARVTLARDDKDSITCYNCDKTSIMQVTVGKAEYERQIKHFQREAHEGQRQFIQVTKRQLHDNGCSRRKQQ
jgi:gag-polypeptide of LTR copia-type